MQGAGALATNAGTTVTVVSGTQVLLAFLTTGTAGTCNVKREHSDYFFCWCGTDRSDATAIFSYSAATDTTALAVASVQGDEFEHGACDFTEPINDSDRGHG
ncbi:MAG: hypothetical protein U1F40_09530 [Turneriella sp.]